MKAALINYIKNPKNDELYTPSYAVTPLIQYIKKGMKIWECTDFGSSEITKVFKENGFNVISTHKNNFNFLTDKPDFDFDIIITNPPYTLKDEFIKKCYEYKKPFCLLLPITSLEGTMRGGLYRQFGIQVMVFDKRINFMKTKKSNWFNCSWFCYNVLPQQLLFVKLEK